MLPVVPPKEIPPLSFRPSGVNLSSYSDQSSQSPHGMIKFESTDKVEQAVEEDGGEWLERKVVL